VCCTCATACGQRAEEPAHEDPGSSRSCTCAAASAAPDPWRVRDLTRGWDGEPAAGEHVFVVTHEPPTSWEHAGTAPFTLVNSVEAAIRAAQEYAGDRIIDVAGGQIGGQALRLGLVDQVVVNLVPAVFGSGRPFFATGPLLRPILFDNPAQVVLGERVTHLVYDVAKREAVSS
jgi:hypothetical protein